MTGTKNRCVANPTRFTAAAAVARFSGETVSFGIEIAMRDVGVWQDRRSELRNVDGSVFLVDSA